MLGEFSGGMLQLHPFHFSRVFMCHVKRIHSVQVCHVKRIHSVFVW